MNQKEQSEFLKRFHNSLPPEDDAEVRSKSFSERYVKDLHTSEGRDPIGELAQSISFQDSAASFLFTGHRGVGKTTELKRLARLLEDDFGCTAILVDMLGYVQEAEPITVGDLLASLVGAFSDQFELRYGTDARAESYWERLRNFLVSEVQIDTVTASAGLPALSKEQLGKVDIKLALKTNPTFKQQLQKALDGSLEKFVRQARQYVDDVVGQIRLIEGDSARKVVLLVDSLEKLRGSGERAREMYESIRATFDGNAANLRLNTIHVVYSVPPFLPILAAGVANAYGGGLCGLPQVKVFRTPDEMNRGRQPHQPGLDQLRNVVERRFPEWKKVFSETQLNRLAMNSGGNLRIYFALVRRVLVKAARVPLPLAGDTLLEYAENDMRAEMPLSEEDRTWLRRIVETHGMGLDREENVVTLARLFDGHLVLDYRNGKPWYDVLPLLHPLLGGR
ncbi:MAG: hypothetical protein HY017_02215 [Betaproteobacteria bacterium]|nr:hypothetical protein [Betaproteobacteria bacterium]